MTAIPGGTHTYSKIRFPGPRLRAENGLGCWLECDDGHGYVDTVAGLGTVSLGYRDQEVDDAIVAQMKEGISFSLPTELEELVAQQLLSFLGWGERVRFSKNGADVTNLAVRLARAHTGRDGIVALDYHGFSDWCQVRSADQRAGIPQGCQFDIADGLEQMPDEALPAAVILEPMPATGATRTVEDLNHYAGWARERGALLIYDCMITGLRLNERGWPDGAPEPDLACYGKAMGNGMPLSACVGSADLMDRITEDVFFSTTFGGECLSLAAASAVMKAYQKRDVITGLRKAGERLNAALRLAATNAGLADELTIVNACGPARPFHRWRTPAQKDTFVEVMLREGILYQGYHNLMHATCFEAPLARIEEAYRAALEAVAAL